MNEDTTSKKPEESGIKEIIKFALIILAIVIPFRLFIAQPYIVEGSSMYPTFENGDYLIVDQISTHFGEPKRGDVIIMRYPKDPSKFFIKRIIGLPNETVTIKDGSVSIQSGEKVVDLTEKYVVYDKKENFSSTLNSGEYFVMGDNRAGSSDSRIWGSLPKENIVGKPVLRLLPMNHMGLFPGIEKEIK